MTDRRTLWAGAALVALIGTLALAVAPQERGEPPAKPAPPPDAVALAQTPNDAPADRPEQKKSAHDASAEFAAPNASTALAGQPDKGGTPGFDFYRDPLNAKKPMQTFEETMAEDVAAKPKVMADQKKLLEGRYDLKAKFDPAVKMSRGKPVPMGPTARLADGTTWEQLGGMTAEAMRDKGIFPYPPLPHPKQSPGGQVFPPVQLAMFPRLTRFDVDHDLPNEFLPEFPPAIFLNNRPELGDVSRGEVVSINNRLTAE